MEQFCTFENDKDVFLHIKPKLKLCEEKFIPFNCDFFNDLSALKTREEISGKLEFIFPSVPSETIKTLCDKKDITIEKGINTIKEYKLAKNRNNIENNNNMLINSNINNNNNNSNFQENQNVNNSINNNNNNYNPFLLQNNNNNNIPQLNSPNINVNQITSIFAKMNIQSKQKFHPQKKQKRTHNEIYKFVEPEKTIEKPMIFPKFQGIKTFNEIKSDMLKISDKNVLIEYTANLLKDLEAKDRRLRLINQLDIGINKFKHEINKLKIQQNMQNIYLKKIKDEVKFCNKMIEENEEKNEKLMREINQITFEGDEARDRLKSLGILSNTEEI